MLDANELERMARERPDECFLKGSGILKLTGAIRQLESELCTLRAPLAVPACPDCKGTGADDPGNPESIPCAVCSGTGTVAPLEVTVERGRIWIKRGHRSFMLDYDDPTPECQQWYAKNLREVLGLSPAHGVMASQPAEPHSLVGFLEKLRPLTDYGRPGTWDTEQAELRRALDSAIVLARALTNPLGEEPSCQQANSQQTPTAKER